MVKQLLNVDGGTIASPIGFKMSVIAIGPDSL